MLKERVCKLIYGRIIFNVFVKSRHFEKETNKVYRRWYGESEEMEIPYDSDLYNVSHSGGWAITREKYFRD